MNELIFLGTGSAASLDRQMTSLCFFIKQEPFLIDCGDGMGTLRQIILAGVPIRSIRTIFLTHHHADHILGIAHFLFVQLFRNPHITIDIYGSKKTLRIAEKIAFLTHEYTKIHKDRLHFHPLHSGDATLLSKGTKVISCRVKGHQQNKIPNYAYKVITNKKTVVFSSDMQPNAAFSHFSKGSDILIHECYGTREKKDVIHSGGHSTAEDAGMLAEKVRAKQLILTHFSGGTKEKELSEIKHEAGKFYKGRITLATDLLRISL
jgi:ribonuclease BN (tRNA processing enzyme)